MTIEERLKSVIGDLVFQTAIQATTIEQLNFKIVELEKKVGPTPTPEV